MRRKYRVKSLRFKSTSNLCISSGSASVDFFFQSCVIFSVMRYFFLLLCVPGNFRSDARHSVFNCLDTRYLCIPVNILEVYCFPLGYLETIRNFGVLLLWFDRKVQSNAQSGVNYAPLLRQDLCEYSVPPASQSGWWKQALLPALGEHWALFPLIISGDSFLGLMEFPRPRVLVLRAALGRSLGRSLSAQISPVWSSLPLTPVTLVSLEYQSISCAPRVSASVPHLCTASWKLSKAFGSHSIHLVSCVSGFFIVTCPGSPWKSPFPIFCLF